MFLIQCRLEGEQLPEILPENLVPIRRKKNDKQFFTSLILTITT